MLLKVFSYDEYKSQKLNIGLLVLRIAFGAGIAFIHATAKLPPHEGFIGTVAGLGFPLPIVFAWMAVLTEFLGGIFIMLGLSTRLIAIALTGNMLVAVYTGFAFNLPATNVEMAAMYLVVFFTFIFMGAGKFSLDSVISKKLSVDSAS